MERATTDSDADLGATPLELGAAVARVNAGADCASWWAATPRSAAGGADDAGSRQRLW